MGRRFAGLWLVANLTAWCQIAAAQTALDLYVAKADPFSTVGLGTTYNVVNTIVDPFSFYTAYVIDMTSQRWRDLSEIDRIDCSLDRGDVKRSRPRQGGAGTGGVRVRRAPWPPAAPRCGPGAP